MDYGREIGLLTDDDLKKISKLEGNSSEELLFWLSKFRNLDNLFSEKWHKIIQGTLETTTASNCICPKPARSSILRKQTAGVQRLDSDKSLRKDHKESMLQEIRNS